ncbi:MAG: hypothetical protein ACI9OD_005037 [Limisphaerales bacterium]|jgi:hypothetical protein
MYAARKYQQSTARLISHDTETLGKRPKLADL